jgi:hypothetical protein
MTYRIARTLIAGVVGGIAWQIAMIVVFGLAQFTLANPDWQSAKRIAVFQTMQPLPRTTAQPFLLPFGLIGISIIYAAVHASIRTSLAGSALRRSMKFGSLLFAVMVPWFEFYLPWNVMHEPFPLVLLECLCWFVVLQCVALAIVLTDQRTQSNAHQKSFP